MLIGPIRYSYTAKEMAAAQGVEHYVYPRFTRTVAPRDVITDKMHSNAAYDILHGNSIRDEQIISDVKACVLQGRTHVILSKYKDHSEKLYSRLEVTGEPDSYGFGDAGFWMQLHEEIRQAGFYIKTASDSCEHFSIIDQNIVWYGNINILGNAKLEDSMMRLESKEITAELMEITFGEKI